MMLESARRWYYHWMTSAVAARWLWDNLLAYM